MKIRNGFVSNSSSSSFIIEKQGKLNNTITVAYNMLKDYFSEYDSYGEIHPKKKSMLSELKTLKSNGWNNVPITFNSTNYDTYIYDLGDGYIYINTCNNVMWDVSNLAVGRLPDVIAEKYNKSIEFCSSHEVHLVEQCYDEYEDEEGFKVFENENGIKYKEENKIDIKYFKLENGYFIQRTPRYESCNKCYHELYLVGGQKFCLQCDKVEIERGLKLNKIIKKLK